MNSKCQIKYKPRRNTFRPSKPIKRKDNIISSSFQNREPFIPGYLNEDFINMHYLMSNEYLRKWWDEQKYYTVLNEEREIKSFPLRPFQFRCDKRRVHLEHKKNVIFKLKQFQNIPSKIDNSWDKILKSQENKNQRAQNSQGTQTTKEDNLLKTNICKIK